ncbi:helix-turn-helix domain-containing protein [Actinomadura roseirufa]|uniref:helix-turn-helix domain-containing protein n=1 Tax=Actinomadura roseirufa TaxID=2094049 RepID=UPI001F5F1433|nr:helix-turn-helix transcriptional regulator [Actinomadura roseirufa]
MRDALTRRDLPVILRIYMHATRLTQEAVANLINTNQGNVSKILNGQRRRFSIGDFESFRDGLHIPGPLLGLKPGLDERTGKTISTSPGTTRDPSWEEKPDGRTHPAKRRPAIDAPRIPGGTVNRSPTPEQEDDDVQRRTAMQIIGSVAAGTAIPPGAMETLFSGLDKALANPLDVARWEAAVHEYGQLIVTRPGGALIHDLTADIFAVNDLLNRHLDATDQAALLRVTAGLSGVLAIDLDDVGDERAARVAWDAATRAADASGDRDLRVWVRGRAAQDAFWAQRPTAVVAGLADDAVEIADGAPSAGLARAHAARAYIAADLGDTRQAHESLNALKRSFDGLPDEPSGQSVLAFRESQLRWAESYVHTQMGNKRAEDTVTRALALYPRAAQTPITNLSLMRATVLVKQRDIDSGLSHAITAYEGQRNRPRGVRLLAGQVLQALPERARNLPAARELRTLTYG